jgi:glucosamine-phosphate N-acetyltransferase
MIIENKFIHNGGKVAHIEDVAILHQFQRQGIGKILIDYLVEVAYNQACYKLILHCSDEVKPFYEKLGFRHVNNGMRYNIK